MILSICTIIIACGALTLSIIGFFGNKKDTQLKIFTDYINTTTNLFARKKEFEKVDGQFDWSILMLNQLEYLSYLVNKKKISLEYANLYKPHIDNWYEKIVLGQLKDYLKTTPEKFKELKELYECLNK